MTNVTFSKTQNRAAHQVEEIFLKGSNQPRGPIAWILERGDLPVLIEAIRNSVAVVMDLETTGLDEYAVSGGLSNGGVGARIVMASLTLPQKDARGDWDGVEPTSYLVPLSHPRSPFLGEWVKLMRLIARTMLKYRTPFVNHHVKFDARWVYATTGIDLTPLIAWDTQSTSHLIDETQSTKLKEVVPRTLGIPRWDDHDLSYPGAAEDVDIWELGEYACIAEGQKVLTHLGEVPIEKVTPAHLLWDGVEWVSHEGVICKGTQPVLQLDNGLKGTADHLVLTEEGDYACLGSIQAGTRRAATPESASARGGLSDPDRAYVARASASDCRSNVRQVREGMGKAYERSSKREERLSLSVGGEVGPRSSRESASRPLPCNSAEMYPWHEDLAPSRRSGDRVPVRLVSGVHSVGSGESSTPQLPGDNFRPDRRGRALRAGESSARGLRGAVSQYASSRACGVHGAEGCPRPSLAPSKDRQPQFPTREGWVGSATPEGDVSGGSNLEAGENYVKVYDILNAGPRSRFTVSGIVVSNCRDTYWTWRLYRHHLAQLFLDPSQPFLEPIGPEEVAEARLGKVAKYVTTPTARCLGMLEQQGIRLDIPYVRKHLKEQREISEQRLDWLADRYGLDRSKASTATAARWFKELTSLAVEESELRIMSMTKSGTPQWTKYVLGKQARQGSETAKMILEQRDAEKQAQFLQSWLEKVTPDGFIHATYRAGHVVTGRLSSAGPNMQQVSKKLRPAFIPRDGYYIADLDYSQLELRVAAHIFKVQPMIDAYHAGLDLHALFAADQLTRRARKIDPNAPLVSIEDVPGEERQKAKAGNFGLLYGQQAQGFRNYADAVYGVELTEAEAQEVYDGFFSTWEGMAEAHAETIRRAASRGYVTSPIGRRRLLPNIMDGNNYLRLEAERQALNAPIQGFGSDLMQMGIASIYGEMPGSTRVPDVYPVATVHDSLVAEVKIETWEEAVAECQERMTHLEPWLEEIGVQLSVPLAADAAVGTRWGVDDIQEG